MIEKESTIYETNSSQHGITLVVAVIMLAGVTFISFALSTVIIREIRTTQTLLKTEPALSGASSGGEIGLFRFLREVGGTTTSGSTPQSGASFQVQANLYDDPLSFSTTNGDEVVVGLYDAEQPANQAADYGSVTVVNNAGSSSVTVVVFSWEDLETPVCSTTVSAGSNYTCSALNNADDRYLVEIDPVPAAGSASGTVTATNNSGGAKGVPSLTPGIDSTGINEDVRRKIEVTF